MLNFGTSNDNGQSSQFTVSADTRQAVLHDITVLNKLTNELYTQSKDHKRDQLFITIENRDQMLDLIDRAKTGLLLSVWRKEWGNQEEFRKWTNRGPHSDPPTGIAEVAKIYKGEQK